MLHTSVSVSSSVHLALPRFPDVLAKSLIPLTRLGAHGSPCSHSAAANLF